MTGTIEARLAELGITLPAAPNPVALEYHDRPAGTPQQHRCDDSDDAAADDRDIGVDVPRKRRMAGPGCRGDPEGHGHPPGLPTATTRGTSLRRHRLVGRSWRGHGSESAYI